MLTIINIIIYNINNIINMIINMKNINIINIIINMQKRLMK